MLIAGLDKAIIEKINITEKDGIIIPESRNSKYEKGILKSTRYDLLEHKDSVVYFKKNAGIEVDTEKGTVVVVNIEDILIFVSKEGVNAN